MWIGEGEVKEDNQLQLLLLEMIGDRRRRRSPIATLSASIASI